MTSIAQPLSPPGTEPLDGRRPGSSPPTTAPGPPVRVRRRLPNALTGLTVVLPCFNEAENVAEAIGAAVDAAQSCATDYEIVVVDDGSTDETSAIAAERAATDPHVRLVVHAHNRGYGEAVRSGIDAARMPWLLLTDADLQFDLRELEDFLADAADADFVMGWRVLRRDAWHRRMNAAAWNRLVGRMFHLPVRDVDCAFKLVRTQLAQEAQLTSKGAMISTELLVKCLADGARLREHPVHHRPRPAGESSGASPKVIVRAFRELAALRRTLRTLSVSGPG